MFEQKKAADGRFFVDIRYDGFLAKMPRLRSRNARRD